MKIYAALETGGIFKLPLLECALDEVVPEYDLMGIADGDPAEPYINEMVVIEFPDEFQAEVTKALHLVYGEPREIMNIPPGFFNGY